MTKRNAVQLTLFDHDIPFKRIITNNREILKIVYNGKTVGYWLDTHSWIDKKNKQNGVGVESLIKYLKK